MDNTISVEEYREKKAQLINQKVELERNPMTQDGKWLEQMKSFLTLAHQASYIAAEANFEAQRDFLRRAVSNLKLLDGNLIVSYTSAFKIAAETANEDMGSHSYEPRGNLSLFTSMYYRAESSDYQGNSRLREVYSSRNLSVLSGIFWLEIA